MKAVNDISLKEYTTRQRLLSDRYRIHPDHAGCYLVNFEHDYICHRYNGGCECLSKCRLIDMMERERKGTDE